MYKDIKWEFQFWPKIMILFELNILYYSTYALSVFIWLPMAKMEWIANWANSHVEHKWPKTDRGVFCLFVCFCSICFCSVCFYLFFISFFFSPFKELIDIVQVSSRSLYDCFILYLDYPEVVPKKHNFFSPLFSRHWI